MPRRAASTHVQRCPMPQPWRKSTSTWSFPRKTVAPFSRIARSATTFTNTLAESATTSVLRVGGVADHIHVLCRFGRTLSIANLLQELKRESSKWIKTQSNTLADFHWQNGYGAFSISPSHVEEVRHYIATQEEHHRTVTFQEEFRRLLSKYGLEWDERYVWD
jgi:putative transposase